MHRSLLLGESPAMLALKREVALAASTSAPVLVLGETGVGKELVARAVHEQSGRVGQSYVAVDCGVLSDDLAASELFGCVRGAFTGATGRDGLLRAAQGGTVLLDEIGTLNHSVQGMLLRVLQERKVRKLGSTLEEPVDVRLVSATNRDLEEAAGQGQFRLDLFYRLGTLTLRVPALRERATDIPLLAQYFVERLNREYDRKVTLTPSAITALQEYEYPGNVRELQHLIHRAYLRATTVLCREHVRLPGSKDIVVAEVRNFWEDLAGPYSRRELTRAQVQDAIRAGLQRTNGVYRSLLSHYGLPMTDYRRFMDFLRRNQCHVDYRQYRGSP